MPGVFEISDKTILKILVRRGLDSERQSVRLDEGELGYTIDTKRVFVGDGLGGGGNVVGNLYQGNFPDVDVVIGAVPGLQPGDTFYDTTESTLYALGEDAATKFDIGPRYEELVLEKTTSSTGKVRISERVFGKSIVGITPYRKAFYFGYDDTEPFYRTNRILELNTNYWAITSKSQFNPAFNDGVFYFGNIGSTSKASLDYRVNINTEGVNSGALIVYGTGTDVFTIGAGGEIGNTQGITSIIGLSGISFYPGYATKSNPSSFLLTASGTAYFQKTGGSASRPAFQVDGFSRFGNSVMINEDLLVVGNLTALGDFSVIETFVTVSSALSVFNSSNNITLTVRQDNINYDTAQFINLNNPTSRIIFDKNCRASFGIGYGAANRNTPSFNNATLSSVHIAGGLVVRDVDAGVSTVSRGMLDVSVNGNANIVSNYNWLDGGSSGTIITKGNTTLPTPPPNSTVALLVRNSANNTAAKFINNAAFGPSIVVGSTAASNATYRLFAGYNSDPGTDANSGNLVASIFSDGGFNFTGTGYVGGSLFVTSDITAYFSSDEKLKDNVIKIESPLEKINKIRGVEFDWNKNSTHEGHDVGVIAQEVEKVLPEVVVTRDDGYKAVRYEKLVPLLIEGIKELHKLIEK